MKLPAECLHEGLVTVGSGGNATYRQCPECGLLVVSQAGRLWKLTLAASAAGP